MKIKNRHILSASCLVLLLTAAFFPDPPLKDRIEKALQVYLTQYPQEKIYLQFDKDYYAAGGTIWFKAYISKDYLPTDLSTILYTELLDKKGKVLQRAKLPIKNGGAWGNFSLPPDMEAGDYRIRAYTLWMLNFDAGFLFARDVHVYTPGAPGDTSEKKTTQPDFSVQFFPEGGDLVDSVESQVAFKAIDQQGYPTSVRGEITDDQHTVVDSFRSFHDGMGSFSFTPQPGRTYQAVAVDKNGLSKTFALPQAQTDGVVLHIMESGTGKIFFQIRRSPKDTARFDQLNLAAHIQGHLVYFAPIDFSQGYTAGLIPVNNDPGGIMQLTLFTPEGTPLAERLAFVKNDLTTLSLELRQDSLSLQPRGKNSFTLGLPDSVRGSFSVSVTDADQVQNLPSQDNIMSHLLLTSDLQGNVFNPAWYFENNDSATNAALDLVMQTNGWRRFVWQKILNQQVPELKYSPESQGISVKGQVIEKYGTLKVGKISMILKAPADSSTYYMNGNITSEGNFEVYGLNFHDTAQLYYKGEDSMHTSRPVTIHFLSNPAEQNYESLKSPIMAEKLAPGATLNRYLELSQERNQVDKLISNRSILLKEVDVTAQKIPQQQKTEDRYTTGMFKSDNGYTFDLTKEDLPYTSIFEYLQGRVAGLMITGDPMNPKVTWRGGTPAFFLDEIPSSAADIGNVPVNNIALIKVYRPPFYGGMGGSAGGIAIYTKKGGDSNYSPGRGFQTLEIPGYTRVRQFYSPDYAVNKKVNELPDKRATLYWNPNLLEDSVTHQIHFSFYNTDVTKRIRIVVEGLSEYGKIVHLEKMIP